MQHFCASNLIILMILSLYIMFRLRDTVDELRHSLETKQNALEQLQQSFLEKEQVFVGAHLTSG